MVSQWKSFYEFWEAQENVFLIRYEDLYANPTFYLSQIIDILGYEVHLADIQRAVDCYPPSGGILKHRGFYTEEDILFVQTELNAFLLKYNYSDLK